MEEMDVVVETTVYYSLFNAIGIIYGEGDGSTTFNLPNLIGKFIEGYTTPGIYKESAIINKTATSSSDPTDGTRLNFIVSDQTGSGEPSNTLTTVQPESLTLIPYIKAYGNIIGEGDLDLTSIDARINTVESSISTLEGKVTTNESSISTLEGKVTANESSISGLTSKVTANESSISGLTSKVTANKSSISSLTSKVTANESSISGLTSKVTTNESSISNLTSKVTANESSISSLTSKVTANESSISELENNQNNYILKSGDRGVIAGYESVNQLSGSQTITINSSDTTYITTSGATTITFTPGDSLKTSTKVIYLTASSTTTLTISGGSWANGGDAPTWGNSGKHLVLVANFIGGRVILSVFDNDDA